MYKVKFQSSDGEYFEVDSLVVEELGILKGMAGGEEVIPLLKVTGGIFKKILLWAEHQKTLDGASAGLGWDEEFLKVDVEILFELCAAANYLAIEQLLDLICKKIANLIKGKTVAEIRKTFNIKTDFTPAEDLMQFEV